MSDLKKLGWIRLHRQIQNNHLYFLEPFTKAHAWIDLFLNANHKEGLISIRGNIVPIKRGQIGWSELTMAERWQWSKDKVRRFLKLLETIQQIEQQKSTITTIITILNYDKFQQDDTTDQTAERQQKDSRRYTNKNDKNVKNDKNTPIGVEIMPYGNPDINEIIEYLKEKQNIKSLDGSTKWNRIYAKNLLTKFKNDTAKLKRFIDYALTDPFHAKNSTSMKYLYNNLNKIALTLKSKQESHIKL